MRASIDFLAPREKEILEVLYRFGSATARQVRLRLKHLPHYSTVRTQLRVLSDKGHVTCIRDGRAYVYAPSVNRRIAGRRALKRVLEVYFDGSREGAIAALHRPDV